MKLQGKTALITGGGTGIGEAIAKGFIEEGAKICITGRRKEKLEEVAAKLPSDSVVICPSDVTSPDDVDKMVKTTLDFGGRIDILVNNAGIDPGGTVGDVDPAVWKKVLDINLTGPFNTTRAVLPHMIENGGGSIVNVASLGGLRVIPGMAPYCTSKAALIMLTKSTALDYGPKKIRCNVLCPGGTRTPMLEQSMAPLQDVLKTDIDGVFEKMASNAPLRRISMPEEMVGPAVFLAGDDSSFMTGAVLLVDGGAAIVDVNGTALSSQGVNWGV